MRQVAPQVTINNNNIYDYFAAALQSSGIYIGDGNNSWSITNNKFYQSATRTWTTGANNSGIYISATASTSGAQNYNITGNIIGYAAPGQTGTYTLTGSNGSFTGIYFNGPSGGTATTISNNTISSVSLTGVTSVGTSTSSPFIGILFTEGNAVTSSNIIGSQTQTGSMTFSTNGAATDVYGIYNFSSNAWTSNNNIIGGFTVNNLGTGNLIFYGLRANTGTSVTWTAGSNIIGGTVANSIQNNSTAAGSQTIGMLTSNAPVILTSNIIRNMTAAGGTGTTTTASLIGISTSSATTANHTISLNTIHSLVNTNSSAATTVTGLLFGSSTGTNTIAKNLIHSLNIASAIGIMNGISVNSGTATYQNNMVRLGINAAGASIITAGAINGINETVAGTNNFYFNSIYIGGTGVGTTASNTYAFQSTITTNTRNYRNNIFMNVRSNATTGGKHYGIRVGGTTVNPTGLTSNHNDIFVSGIGTVYGFYNSADVATATAWNTATGQDGSSVNADPQFIDPAGTSATVDLHIHATNPTVIEGNGFLIASVTDDYDGQPRSGLTPTDIGADAANFTAVSGTVTLGTNNISAGTINQGTINNPIYSFSITATGANTNITGLNIITTGSYVAAEITNLKAWYQSSSTFNAGTATLLSTISAPGVAGSKTFTSFISQTIAASATGYIFITVDVPCVAIPSNTIAVNAVTSANATFSSGAVSGSPASGNTQTIGAVLPVNVTTPAASVANASSAISWTNPAGCYDEIMIVAATASNTGVPSGNGSAYTAALAFGSGTALGNGFVVYKGATSPQTVTGLTNGTPYFYKIFTRLGSNWSSGIEVSATPNITYCTPTNSTSTTYISNFTTTLGITNIANTSTYTTGGYANYTAQSVSQYPGSAINYSIAFVNGSVGIAIWVDWNNNGVFTDAGETMYNSGTYISTSPNTGSFTIPAGAAVGSYRMRVMIDWNATSPNSCSSSGRGETEDYTLTVAAATSPNCANYTTPAASATNICSPGSLNWTAPSSGGVPTGYKLYFGTDGAGITNPTNKVNGTNLGNVLTYTFSGLTAATTYYWRVVPTNASGDATSCTIQSFTTAATVAELVTPVSDDFENCPEWLLVNAATNKWAIGSATGNPSRSIYISNDNGVSNAYTNSTSQVSHFYRDITFPSGETIYNFTFQLKGQGEVGYDRLRIFLAPTSYTVTAGTIPSGAGITELYLQASLTGGVWTSPTLTTPLNATLVGNTSANSTRRIIFTWENDGLGGVQPPAAVDNINITSSVPSPTTIGTIAATQQTGNVYQNSVNNNILRIEIPATGSLGTQTLTSVKVTSANTSDADITANGVSLWTGTATAPATQIGTSQSFASGVATFAGLNTSITAGTTYLWVRYNLTPTATGGNIVDAIIATGDISFTAAGGATAAGTQPAVPLDPAGSRPIIPALCGNLYTINSALPTGGMNYASFTAAINDLNARGISCSVVFNVKDGQTFNELPPDIVATGTAANTITFQRDNSTGTKPILSGTAGVGTGDAVLVLISSDYFTWDGIDLRDNSANTTGTTQLEYGIYLFAATTGNGCKNNTFKNFFKANRICDDFQTCHGSSKMN
ncbi:MAG: fibronectin type III domain-containing protein [Sphingobacteriales bacterium]|nr:MAG: fibronectin type III domain-containing protein [Sphingobacteriales bacterium]